MPSVAHLRKNLTVGALHNQPSGSFLPTKVAQFLTAIDIGSGVVRRGILQQRRVRCADLCASGIPHPEFLMRSAQRTLQTPVSAKCPKRKGVIRREKGSSLNN
jgi:hypothetical protein